MPLLQLVRARELRAMLCTNGQYLLQLVRARELRALAVPLCVGLGLTLQLVRARELRVFRSRLVSPRNSRCNLYVRGNCEAVQVCHRIRCRVATCTCAGIARVATCTCAGIASTSIRPPARANAVATCTCAGIARRGETRAKKKGTE